MTLADFDAACNDVYRTGKHRKIQIDEAHSLWIGRRRRMGENFLRFWLNGLSISPEQAADLTNGRPKDEKFRTIEECAKHLEDRAEYEEKYGDDDLAAAFRKEAAIFRASAKS